MTGGGANETKSWAISNFQNSSHDFSSEYSNESSPLNKVNNKKYRVKRPNIVLDMLEPSLCRNYYI